MWASTVTVALLLSAGGTEAQIQDLLLRGDDGTAYQVLLNSGTRTARVTSIAGGSAAAAASGVTCAIGGAVTGQLADFDLVRRTAILLPNDINAVGFDSNGAGAVTLGSGPSALEVCRVSGDCATSPQPIVGLDSASGGVAAACIAAGATAPCAGGPLDVFAFGLPASGTTCSAAPTTAASLCAPLPTDGFTLVPGEAIVFIYPAPCDEGFATASGSLQDGFAGCPSDVGAAGASNASQPGGPGPCALACPQAPAAGCLNASKSGLTVKNNDDDTKDGLTWKWLKGEETLAAAFGDPLATTSYAFCLYAGTANALVGTSVVPPDALLWKATSKGFAFKDKAGVSGGIRKVLLKAGDSGKAKALVKAGGAGQPDLPLPLVESQFPLTVQLLNDATAACWETSFEQADVSKNDAGALKAKRN